jgi:NADH:ubiquinone reductase (H+-translocating)
MPPSSASLRRVVIVGGGFGGLYAAQALANKPLNITLIDRKNHHTFQPLLYQVALAVLSPADIASPLRQILRHARNIDVVLGEVVTIDVAAQTVTLNGGEQLHFDYLIVAAGARHSYFGHDEWEKDAPGLKTVEDAVEIRRRLMLAFEGAERRALLDGEGRAPTFAVIGAGPTGVELAGAIADLARLALAKDFRAIHTRDTRVMLFEGGDRVLPALSPKSSSRARRQLEELGVEVHTNSLVKSVENGRIQVADRWIEADAIVWATGVAASPLARQLSATTDRSGRIAVEPDLSLPGHPNIFVIGDMSSLTDVSGRKVPGLGAAATQQGRTAANNILRDLRGLWRVPFRYEDWGNLATIGHARAVAEFGKTKLTGWIAWLTWSFVHIYLLIGFRNRALVMLQWIWAYITRSGASPLITDYGSTKVDETRHDKL